MNERRQKILETLASEPCANPGKRITTAASAKSVGVSEAALTKPRLKGGADVLDSARCQNLLFSELLRYTVQFTRHPE